MIRTFVAALCLCVGATTATAAAHHKPTHPIPGGICKSLPLLCPPDEPGPPPEPEPEPTPDPEPGGLRYLSPTGSDGADGQTPQTAWRTMQHAAENAPGGATACLLPGAYPGFSWRTYTGRTGYVTFRPCEGASPVVGAIGAGSATVNWVAFEGLTTGAIGLRGQHLRFRGLRIPSAGGTTAISVEDGSSDVLIEGNDVGRGSPLPSTCIGLWSSFAEPRIADVTIRGNRCDGLQIVGMNIRNFERVLVEGNLVANITRPDSRHSDAIRTYAGGRGLVVRRNVMRDNAAIGFFIKDGRVADVEFVNNVVGPHAGAFYGFQVYDTDRIVVANNTVDDGGLLSGTVNGVTMFNNVFASFNTDRAAGTAVSWTCRDHNVFGATWNSDPGPNGQIAAPRYVSGDAGDDWRLADGSPGIDDGTARCGTTLAPATDITGAARPQGGAFDVGAHER